MVQLFHKAWSVFVWCNVILPDTCGSCHADMKVRERERERVRSQECQFVEVATVALRQSKSASDDLMEGLFNPTSNRVSAEVCTVRQMCV